MKTEHAACGMRHAEWTRRAQLGQSTLEYILVLAAILVAIIAAAGTFMKPAAEKALQDSSGVITAATAKVKTGLGLP